MTAARATEPPVYTHPLNPSQIRRSFAKRCVAGICADAKRTRKHLEQSLMLATALSPHIGCEKTAKIAQCAHHEGTSLREAVQFDTRVRRTTKPEPCSSRACC